MLKSPLETARAKFDQVKQEVSCRIDQVMGEKKKNNDDNDDDEYFYPTCDWNELQTSFNLYHKRDVLESGSFFYRLDTDKLYPASVRKKDEPDMREKAQLYLGDPNNYDVSYDVDRCRVVFTPKS